MTADSHPCNIHLHTLVNTLNRITAVKHHTWNILHGSWIPIYIVNVFYMVSEFPSRQLSAHTGLHSELNRSCYTGNILHGSWIPIHAVNVHMHTLVYTLKCSHHTGNILHGSWIFIYSVPITTPCFPSSLSPFRFKMLQAPHTSQNTTSIIPSTIWYKMLHK